MITYIGSIVKKNKEMIYSLNTNTEKKEQRMIEITENDVEFNV